MGYEYAGSGICGGSVWIWNMWDLVSVGIGICEVWNLQELNLRGLESAGSGFWDLNQWGLESVRSGILESGFCGVGICEAWNMWDMEYAGSGICGIWSGIWNMWDLESAGFGICRVWNLRELNLRGLESAGSEI